MWSTPLTAFDDLGDAMEKYEHLAEHVLEIMQLSDSERIETLFTDRWIGYKKAITIMEHIDRYFESP